MRRGGRAHHAPVEAMIRCKLVVLTILRAILRLVCRILRRKPPRPKVRDDMHPPGTIVKASDRSYIVTKDGSMRRIREGDVLLLKGKKVIADKRGNLWQKKSPDDRS
jgi:hypothetical protein